MKKGKLKIYLGYSAGVGKTYSMLLDAINLKKEGIDVVIGYFEPHKRKDTIDLTLSLEKVPLKEINYKNILLHELDVEKVIKRNPNLVLIDELAHTNAINSFNKKRYLDVLEILNHGINVYTTLNIQHLEGLNSLLKEEMFLDVYETVPDNVFDLADEIKIIDIEPSELIKRFKDGKIYDLSLINVALNNFFTLDNLIFLRETCLRRAIDRLNTIKNNGLENYKILTLISQSPNSKNLILFANKLANKSDSKFIALYIKNKELNEEEEKSLKENIKLVKDLNGEVVIKYSSDLIEAIYSYITLYKVSTLIIGKSFKTFFKNNLEEKIINTFNDLEILILPNKINKISPLKLKKIKSNLRLSLFISSTSLFLFSLILYFINNLVGTIFLFISLILLCGSSSYFYFKNLNYKKRLNINVKMTDYYDYILSILNKDDHKTTLEKVSIILSEIFLRSLIVYNKNNEYIVLKNNDDLNIINSPKERTILKWAYFNKCEAGNNTLSLNDSNIYYYPVIKNKEILFIIGFLASKKPMNEDELLLLNKISNLIKQIL